MHSCTAEVSRQLYIGMVFLRRTVFDILQPFLRGKSAVPVPPPAGHGQLPPAHASAAQLMSHARVMPTEVRESEHLLLELYSTYRPQHRTHLVVSRTEQCFAGFPGLVGLPGEVF